MSEKNRSGLPVTGMAAALLLAAGLPSTPAQACGGIDSFIASMCVFAGNFAPRNYAFAQGQLLPISSNTALFSLVGTLYGGDGRTTFALPDTRGRALIGAGQGPGLSNYRVGQRGGLETVTLTAAQMPSHNHGATTTVSASATANANSLGNSADPAGNVWAFKGRTNIYSDQAPNVTMSAAAISINATGDTAIGNTGGSQGHENRPPFLAMNWIIALQGTFPSRN